MNTSLFKTYDKLAKRQRIAGQHFFRKFDCDIRCEWYKEAFYVLWISETQHHIIYEYRHYQLFNQSAYERLNVNIELKLLYKTLRNIYKK